MVSVVRPALCRRVDKAGSSGMSVATLQKDRSSAIPRVSEIGPPRRLCVENADLVAQETENATLLQ